MSILATKYKLLRSIIDIDGNQTKENISQLISENFFSSYLFDYDIKTQRFDPTPESVIYDLALEYYQTYSELITSDIIIEKINSAKLQPRVKEEVMSVVNGIIGSDFVETELNFLLKEIAVDYAKNKIVSTSQQALTRLENDADIDATISYVQKNIGAINILVDKRDPLSTTSLHISEFAELMIQKWENGDNIYKPVAHFGLRNLDEGLGGLRSGEITVLGGLPGVGKSIIAQNIAQHNAFQENRNVIYATTENTPEQIWSRMIASVTGLPLKKIMQNALTTDEKEIFIDAQKSLAQWTSSNFWIIPHAKAENPMILRTSIEGVLGSEKLDLLVVDHVNNMSMPGETERWRIVEACIAGCKNLALRFDCACLSPTHLNRKGDSTEAGMEAMQFQSINQLADHVLMITADKENPCHPPEYNEWQGRPGRLIITNPKGRTAAANQRFFLSADLSVASVSVWNEYKKPETLQ